MSVDFVPKLVMDSRLALSDKRDFPVYQSAAAITPQVFAASTASASNITYTVQVPSLENLTEMVILARSRVTLNVTGTVVTTGQFLLAVDSGTPADFCLNAFPFHQLMTTSNVTVNQSQFNIDMQNVLPSMLYMIGRDQLSEYNNMCPTMLDNVSDYTQAGYVGSNSSVFNSWFKNFGYKNSGRGSWTVVSCVGNTATTAPNQSRTVAITFETVEPLLISPFTFGKLSPALQGVQTINVNINLDQGASRYIKFASAVNAPVVALGAVSSDLQVVFLAPKASQLAKFNPRNVLNFYKADRYISSALSLTAGGGTFNSPSIQLSSIPKAILVTIRPVQGNPIAGTITTPNWFLPITGVNIQFNTRSGLLSSASQYQLYKMSAESGIQMSWQDWSGYGEKPATGDLSLAAAQVRTIGSVLALTFGEHIEISEEYSAPSSLGQWNLQVACNYGANAYAAAGQFELCMVVINEGLVSTERGNTNSYVNLLSKQTVMDVIGDVPKYDAVVDSITESVDNTLEGGRRRHKMAHSGMGRSGGKSKLHSRLM